MFMTRCNLQEGGKKNSPDPNITLHFYNCPFNLYPENQFEGYPVKSPLKKVGCHTYESKKNQVRTLKFLGRSLLKVQIKWANNNQFSSRLKSKLKPFIYVACAQKKRKKGDDVTLQVLDPDEPEKSAK